MINLLLCSSSGFSGMNILEEILKIKDYNVAATYRKKENQTKFKNLKLIKQDLAKSFKLKFKPQYIIVCANSHKIEDFENNKNYNYKNNILIARKVSEYAKKTNKPILIYFSTVDISYNNCPENKKTYINSKIESEKIFKTHLKKNCFKKIIFLRLPAILGKKCNKNFLSNTKKRLKLNKDIFLWNSKSNYNNFIHIKDITRLINHIISNNQEYKKSSIINCLTSSPVSTHQTIVYMKKKMKSRSKLILKDNLSPKLNLRKEANIKKFYFLTNKKTIDLFLRD
jgi:nucleoside-diphosphate-sugar epimerase